MEISGLTELAYLWSPHIHSRSSRTVVSVLDVFFNTDDILKSVTIIFLGGPQFWYLDILWNERIIFLGGLNIFRRASRVKRCKISSTGNWVGNIKLKPDYHNFPHKDNDQILKDFQHILDRQKLCIFYRYISNSGIYLTVALYIYFINFRWIIQRTRLWTRLLFWHCRCCGSHNSLRGFHPLHPSNHLHHFAHCSSAAYQ